MVPCADAAQPLGCHSRRHAPSRQYAITRSPAACKLQHDPPPFPPTYIHTTAASSTCPPPAAAAATHLPCASACLHRAPPMHRQLLQLLCMRPACLLPARDSDGRSCPCPSAAWPPCYTSGCQAVLRCVFVNFVGRHALHRTRRTAKACSTLRRRLPSRIGRGTDRMTGRHRRANHGRGHAATHRHLPATRDTEGRCRPAAACLHESRGIN